MKKVCFIITDMLSSRNHMMKMKMTANIWLTSVCQDRDVNIL